MNSTTQKNALHDTWSFWYAPRGKNAIQTGNYFDNLKCLGNTRFNEKLHE